MKLSVIIPLYNERDTIKTLIEQLQAVDLKKEIIIIDDSSLDGSKEILQQIQDPGITVLYHQKNLGKTASIRTGLEHVTGDIVIIQDADLEYDPKEFPKILKAFQEQKVEAVFGSRYTNLNIPLFCCYWLLNKAIAKVLNSRFLINRHGLKKQLLQLPDRLFRHTNEHPGRDWKKMAQFYDFKLLIHLYGTCLLTSLANALYGLVLTDETTCYKAIKTDVLKGLKIQSERFDFCPEVVAKLARKKYRIVEIPISHFPRKVYQGKKSRIQDGFSALRTLIKYRFIQL